MSEFKKGDKVRFIASKPALNSTFFNKGLTGLTVREAIRGGYSVYESDMSDWWLVREWEIEREVHKNRIGGEVL